MHQFPSPEVPPMFRFDHLIRRDMIIRDVKQRHPETIAVFENLHYRAVCDDCDIQTVARKNGLDVRDVVDALNAAAFGSSANTQDHASNHQ
jgi:hypothetical protein